LQEIVPSVVEGNGTEAGHVISTTIGGRDGQPKQVSIAFIPSSEICFMILSRIEMVIQSNSVISRHKGKLITQCSTRMEQNVILNR